MIRYNNLSPLENYHVSEALRILQVPEFDFLKNCKEEHQKYFKNTMINLVMATDMTVHFEIFESFKESFEIANILRGNKSVESVLREKLGELHVRTKPDLTTLRFLTIPLAKDSSNKSFCSSSLLLGYQSSGPNTDKGSPPPEQRKSHVRLLFQGILKLADLGHTMRPKNIHHTFVRCLVGEFWGQGAEEEKMKLPVNPLMNRHIDQAALYKSQKGFLEYVVKPFADTISVITKVRKNQSVESILCIHHRESASIGLLCFRLLLMPQ